MPLTFPWGKGLGVDAIEAYWDELKFPDGTAFVDYTHAETGAPVLKAQHPEFELWSEGIHARSGVSCADCHMPYAREGASKVSDHWVRSPLLAVNRACQTCHRVPEGELLARVNDIQERNYALLKRGGAAIVDLIDALVAAQGNALPDDRLTAARTLQRRAQWRLDYIAAENSMGFHAPQVAAKALAEAIDYARQGQLIAMGAAPQPVASVAEAQTTATAPGASGTATVPSPSPSARPETRDRKLD
jgi:nitrite reductase (cytochrome c-552)